MTVNNSNNHQGQSPAAASAARRRSPWPLMVVAALLVIVPFMSWYGTWFGRELSNEQIEEYLGEEKNPRHVQHALSQLAGRMAKDDAAARRWYPQLVALTGDEYADVRMTAAWAMGQDNQAGEFRAPLGRLLQDPEPIVRRNAALALVRFNDAAGRPELLAMLRPFVVNSPFSGTLTSVLGEGRPVTRGALLARVADGNVGTHEVRAPLPGRIAKISAAVDSRIAAGSELLTLGPDGGSVWESLRALSLIGGQEDLPDVERYARGVAGMSEEIKKQAVKTAEAIRNRPSVNSS